MPIRGTDLMASTTSLAILCIEEYSGYEIAGRLYYPHDKSMRKFTSIYQMIQILDGLFDKYAFPQAMHPYRTFSDKKGKKNPACAENEAVPFTEDIANIRGKIGTFFLHVRFRQNTTWQGSIQSVEKGKMLFFRSDLELINILVDCLNHSNQA